MPIKVLMPALSPTMKSGAIAKWHKNEGDKIKTGDIIADIETDKAVIEFEYADEPGTLHKVLTPEGTKNVAVNQVIAVLEVDGDDATALLAACQSGHPTGNVENSSVADSPAVDTVTVDASETSTADIQAAQANTADTRVKASPLARRLASQMAVDLSKVEGSGPYGRVVKEDIVRAADNASTPAQIAVIPGPVVLKRDGDAVPISSMRRVIAERLVESKRDVPHFYLAMDCMVGELLAMRAKINADSEALGGGRITVNDIVIKSVALALREFPEINASWGGDKIIQNSSIDIAFAVSIDDGLLTPVIADADKLSLSAIAQVTKSLAARAKERKLLPHEFQGGCMTVSNLGMFGVKEFYAIINPPQSCIMAVGKSEKRPVVVDDCIVAEDVMTVTLSVDHRVVDGALAAKFFNRFKFYIEHPLSVLL
ncbi:pyruvate dehydrogenase complex dihydrolipoamide acetyltransferase [Candidatus Anaplasma sp. TIGMIC]|uniref:pyruvate dehydrogenase complex dihydrolipoamide acetyltransferase n=1 Tax=Candidatus Anaplasma sp. TIGMIC TaxID=3020713 RepID=UPI002330E10D|nr:pyruvate dehydrogenase complex dihydrolipoamide acetyltransferase [Candidatus Anaplasma sp. TIGMIC]MDB1135451.1 pyruvate dehydrogenase complex dihydrolipoamide acetyltransferase [Candidatus Anaplasma sp. TIGMIC]